MELFYRLQNSLLKNNERNAFYIKNQFFTYAQLSQIISNVRHEIISIIPDDEKIVGLVINDDIETYAAILALWFEGKAYVPINPDMPEERNRDIIAQAFLKTIIDSSEKTLFTDFKIIRSFELPQNAINLSPKSASENALVYILFTSGTTGKPKGVPISRKNLSGFVAAFDDLGLDITEDDRCLQMFELTFDLSVISYLIPLIYGACIYTTPKDKIKYSAIFELMDDHQLTFSLMVPSILQYLRPYFEEIDVPTMKYSLFCGEALSLDITSEWSRCVPNAKVLNVYGPTEDTIFCTSYQYTATQNKTHNGILSIGKPMLGTITIIVDENNTILPENTVGELCLGGIQLTEGYWHNPEKNKDAFFNCEYLGVSERFYRTGDLCKADDEGDLVYLGRTDFQTKIQGFRVELSEIEFHIKSYLDKINVVALAIADQAGNSEIAIVVESQKFDTVGLTEFLKLKLPHYMLPRKIIFEPVFPLNSNGKTDRNKLASLF